MMELNLFLMHLLIFKITLLLPLTHSSESDGVMELQMVMHKLSTTEFGMISRLETI